MREPAWGASGGKGTFGTAEVIYTTSRRHTHTQTHVKHDGGGGGAQKRGAEFMYRGGWKGGAAGRGACALSNIRDCLVLWMPLQVREALRGGCV